MVMVGWLFFLSIEKKKLGKNWDYDNFTLGSKSSSSCSACASITISNYNYLCYNWYLDMVLRCVLHIFSSIVLGWTTKAIKRR